MRKIYPLLIFFILVSSCIPARDGYPFQNLVSYAFEALDGDKVLGVGHLEFLIEDDVGFILYNLFTLNMNKSITPVKSQTHVIEVSQMESRKAGLYIIIGKHIMNIPVVGTIRRMGASYPLLEDTPHIDFQITIQQKTPYSMRPLSRQGLQFYKENMPGIDLGQSPGFSKYKYSN
jgi:hypothetical protein